MVSESLPAKTPVDTGPIYCSPALEDAWRRFGEYDKTATKAERRFIRQRAWMVVLGVLVTTLVVLDVIVERSLGVPDHGLTLFFTWAFSPLGLESAAIATVLDRGLNFAIILIPIIISILVAGSVKFNTGISAVMLRSGAEAIRREIYRYRTQTDLYRRSDHAPPRDVILAQQLEHISRRVMDTQINLSELEVYDYKHDGLPPIDAVAPGDDGFSDLTPDQYLRWRLDDQFEHHRLKARRLARELRRFQWAVYIMGGLGTLLAAIELELWVAVTTIGVASLSSFLEFKRVETTLMACNLAASDLYDLRSWWRALPDRAKKSPTNTEILVRSTEAAIRGANAAWFTEMREALVDTPRIPALEASAEPAEEPDDDWAIAILSGPQTATSRGSNGLNPSDLEDEDDDTLTEWEDSPEPSGESHQNGKSPISPPTDVPSESSDPSSEASGVDVYIDPMVFTPEPFARPDNDAPPEEATDDPVADEAQPDEDLPSVDAILGADLSTATEDPHPEPLSEVAGVYIDPTVFTPEPFSREEEDTPENAAPDEVELDAAIAPTTATNEETSSDIAPEMAETEFPEPGGAAAEIVGTEIAGVYIDDMLFTPEPFIRSDGEGPDEAEDAIEDPSDGLDADPLTVNSDEIDRVMAESFLEDTESSPDANEANGLPDDFEDDMQALLDAVDDIDGPLPEIFQRDEGDRPSADSSEEQTVN